MSDPAAIAEKPEVAFIPFEDFWAAHYAPRHARELATEQQWHDEAFAATTLTVAGVELRGATPYDLLLLHGCGNPLVAGGLVLPAHLRQFFALLADPAPDGWLARRRLHRHLDRQPYRPTVRAVRTYLDRMFACADLPSAARPEPAQGPPDTASAESQPLPMCFLAPLVVEIAAGTGWTEEAILSMRLDKLFQYRRALRRQQGGSTHAFHRADRLLSEALLAHSHYLDTGELPAPVSPGS